MPHTIEITCYADLEELIASIVKLVGEISGKEVCQRNADDLRQAAVAIETMLAESAAIPPAVALLARCPECGSYDRESCARPYHICLNLWHKPPVQDHGPRVDTKGQGFNVAIGGKAALYFGCWDQTGHFLRDVHGRTVYDGYEDLPWVDGLMDGGLLKNGKVPDSPDGRVFWTAGGAKAFWYAFYWWDRSVDTRGACNSGIYVRGFGWPEAREAFEYGCAQFPNVVRRQRYPLVLQDVGAATSQEAGSVAPKKEERR